MAPREDVKTLKSIVFLKVLGFSVVYRVKVVHDIKHIKVLKTLCFCIYSSSRSGHRKALLSLELVKIDLEGHSRAFNKKILPKTNSLCNISGGVFFAVM